VSAAQPMNALVSGQTSVTEAASAAGLVFSGGLATVDEAWCFGWSVFCDPEVVVSKPRDLKETRARRVFGVSREGGRPRTR